MDRRAHLRRLAGIIGRNKTLFQNFSFLTALQVFNLGLPLMTYPYLIRVLGVQRYGLIIFARALIQFFIIAVDFGFSVPSARSVSINRDDPDKLSEIVSAVLSLKLMLFLFCTLVLVGLVVTIPSLRQEATLYLLTMAVGLEEILYPIWFFQGQEKMRFITYVEITSKLTFAGLIFLAIHSPADYLWYPALQAIGIMVGGSFSCYLLFFRFKVRFKPVPVALLRHYLKESSTFFISKVAITIQERTNTLLVGTFLGATEVAYYDLANKVVSIAKIPFYMLNETIYPHVARNRDMGFVKKAMVLSFGGALLLYAAISGLAKPIIMVLAGKELLAARPLFPLLALILPIIGISYLLGNNMLVVMGHGRKANLSEVFSALFFLLLVLVLYLGQMITMYTLIIAYLAANLVILVYRYACCRALRLI